jgi:hypothetical protein
MRAGVKPNRFMARFAGVVVGDMHGTVEAPQFIGALISHLVKSGRPIVVGLEYPRNEQADLDAFLHAAPNGSRKTISLLSVIAAPVALNEFSRQSNLR